MTTQPKIPVNLLGVFENISPVDQEKIITGWSHPRSIVSFRVNNLRSSRAEVIEELKKAALPYSVWTHSEDAFYMDKEHEYTLRGLEIYKAGKIYVQSLSSMIPALCLDLIPDQKILDMAAAPGSKTTQIASMLSGKCKITALEKFGVRLEKLVHTIKSQGAENCVEVIKIDATELVAHYSKDEKGNKGAKMFDRILLDVPCSSDGRINLEDEKTYCWYSGEKSHSKSTLQYEMLEQARKMLVDGGKIVYSTCSISRRENEDVVQKFLKTHPEFTLLPSPIAPDYTLEDNMNRWYPSPMMEGFFVAILERK
ncbi:RsmB/NOP family class I SAM-dependent RNA methyltransferase [Candidatus Gracilibacteria bacterium]|nr:RsmB/NOP family class I SAM-dependent RNA methyltransferase [Candidatus Gracilibacteria bacterium]